MTQEGDGWRVAWDGQRSAFPLLIGGNGWASELTAAEGAALCQALRALQSQFNTLRETLMEEETLSLEFQGGCPGPQGGEEGRLWVDLEGDRRDWSLRFVLEPARGLRGLEGSWTRGAARPFLEAFCQLDPEPPTPQPGALKTSDSSSPDQQS